MEKWVAASRQDEARLAHTDMTPVLVKRKKERERIPINVCNPIQKYK
jgi:hypothetical protein